MRGGRSGSARCFLSRTAAGFRPATELVLLRIPAPVRAALYVAGAYVFILAGRFESNAFIYFQF